MHGICGADESAARLAAAKPRVPGLSELEFDVLSERGLIDAVIACERLARHVQALLLRTLGALERRGASELDRACTETQVAVALRLAPTTARDRLDLARALTGRFPETLELLERGQVAVTQANALAEITAALDRDTARAVQERVLTHMPEQNTAATRKALRRAVLVTDPDGAQQRHQRQAARRRLESRPEEDGMATVSLYTTAQTAVALMNAVSQYAQCSRARGDNRTLDQRRADALATLVLQGSGGSKDGGGSRDGGDAGSASGVRFNWTQHPDTRDVVRPAALVQVTVGVATLLGTDERPGDLHGYGPIDAAQARALAFAPGSVWRRLITAPDGTLLHVDPHNYRPPAALARLVRLRDQTCAFPGCAMPAPRCDLDHVEPFNHVSPAAGGTTTLENLQALCRHHHGLKTARRWNAVREHATGTTTWTAPTGHSYITRPKPLAGVV